MNRHPERSSALILSEAVILSEAKDPLVVILSEAKDLLLPVA
jgi:hypothetical protein